MRRRSGQERSGTNRIEQSRWSELGLVAHLSARLDVEAWKDTMLVQRRAGVGTAAKRTHVEMLHIFHSRLRHRFHEANLAKGAQLEASGSVRQ